MGYEDNKTIIERTVHHYTFTVPELPCKRGLDAEEIGKRTKKRSKEKGTKGSSRQRLRIRNTSENGVEAWWEDYEKDY